MSPEFNIVPPIFLLAVRYAPKVVGLPQNREDSIYALLLLVK